MNFAVEVTGAKKVVAKVQAEVTRIHALQDKAAKAGAQVLVPFVKAALPRDSKSKRPGYLRSHVKVYQDIKGQGVAKVKLTGTLAHLVFGNTKQHTITPLGAEDAQVHRYNRRAHARMQGPQLAKRAINWAGAQHPSPRAVVPAHRGAASPLLRVRVEHQPEVVLAAREVLLHGR